MDGGDGDKGGGALVEKGRGRDKLEREGDEVEHQKNSSATCTAHSQGTQDLAVHGDANEKEDNEEGDAADDNIGDVAKGMRRSESQRRVWCLDACIWYLPKQKDPAEACAKIAHGYRGMVKTTTTMRETVLNFFNKTDSTFRSVEARLPTPPSQHHTWETTVPVVVDLHRVECIVGQVESSTGMSGELLTTVATLPGLLLWNQKSSLNSPCALKLQMHEQFAMHDAMVLLLYSLRFAYANLGSQQLTDFGVKKATGIKY
ncbi:hypothetical protein JB92DRAFT_2837737 [Gautieria morchelliformis]|nr:hypothetical protein JB92DRAFT_2837737 [Gautieria morchelliformis]